MKLRLPLVLGLALAAALHVVVTGQLAAPGLALLIGLAGAVVGPRLQLAQAAQALVVVATAGLVFLLGFLEPPLDPALGGPKLQYAVFSGTALLTFGGRMWMRNPERGHPVTWLIGLVAFFSCGRVASEPYLPLAAAYLLLATLHGTWEAGARTTRRHLLVALGVLGVVGLVGGGSAAALRRLYDRADAWIIAGVGGSQAGFGAGSFQLGSMDGMLMSDEVILRVHGPAPEHFRGQAYTAYGGATWFPPQGGELAPPAPAPDGDVSVIEFVDGDQERLFLPGGAGAVASTPSGLVTDALGIPRPADGATRLTEVRFSQGSPRFPSPPPGPDDLEVPSEVAAAIGPLVESWTAGADTDRQRVERIRERLEQDFTYSLEYERHEGTDPVVQFMLESRLGHCEYFATAAALAARSQGVPARVVTGFRSDEVSPLSGHRIVRSRDAHAWVEVWLDGAWETLDPAPRSVAGSTLEGLADDARLFWSRWGLQTVAGLLLVVFVVLQVRTLLRNRDRAPAPLDEAWVEGPPAFVLALLQTLAGLDLARRADEPVESFADRAEQAGQAEAAALLRRYAALRYGGVGDEGELASAMGVWRPSGRGAA